MKTLFVVTRTRGHAWDAGNPIRSQDQWAEHATFMNGLAADGFVVLGGPLGDGHKAMLVVAAADESEIQSTLAQDPWSQSGILAAPAIERWTILLEASSEEV